MGEERVCTRGTGYYGCNCEFGTEGFKGEEWEESPLHTQQRVGKRFAHNFSAQFIVKFKTVVINYKI
jgi:hypothetical protein